MTRLTRHDIAEALGPLDDVTIAEIIGTEATVSELAEASFDRLELEGDVDPKAVQVILDLWER